MAPIDWIVVAAYLVAWILLPAQNEIDYTA